MLFDELTGLAESPAQNPLCHPAATPGGRERTATTRQFLMCRPTHFAVDYAINPWMDPARGVDRARAVEQWETLRGIYLRLGHEVRLIPPAPGLPDMVFAANGATVVNGQALGARFRAPERGPEGALYLDWLRAHGYPQAHAPRHVNEGEGDYLFTGETLLAGTGFRTDPRSHAEAAELFGVPVVSLRLVDPRYYHLDTALCVLDEHDVMYYPDAFSVQSQGLLRELYPDAILATAQDAAVLGLNAVSDGRNVVMAAAATTLAARLRERGFQPVPVDLTELLKAGGGAKCCTLELRARRR